MRDPPEQAHLGRGEAGGLIGAFDLDAEQAGPGDVDSEDSARPGPFDADVEDLAIVGQHDAVATVAVGIRVGDRRLATGLGVTNERLARFERDAAVERVVTRQQDDHVAGLGDGVEPGGRADRAGWARAVTGCLRSGKPHGCVSSKPATM